MFWTPNWNIVYSIWFVLEECLLCGVVCLAPLSHEHGSGMAEAQVQFVQMTTFGAFLTFPLQTKTKWILVMLCYISLFVCCDSVRSIEYHMSWRTHCRAWHGWCLLFSDFYAHIHHTLFIWTIVNLANHGVNPHSCCSTTWICLLLLYSANPFTATVHVPNGHTCGWQDETKKGSFGPFALSPTPPSWPTR